MDIRANCAELRRPNMELTRLQPYSLPDFIFVIAKIWQTSCLKAGRVKWFVIFRFIQLFQTSDQRHIGSIQIRLVIPFLYPLQYKLTFFLWPGYA